MVRAGIRGAFGLHEKPVTPSAGINLKRLYEYRFRGVDQEARQSVWNEIAKHVYAAMGSPEKVLDPAAGRAEFIKAIPARERWVVDEVDHGAAVAPGIKCILGNALEVQLPEAYFDGVFVSNFLEHLRSPEEIATLLGRMREALQPGGRIAVMGPNYKYCAREYFDCADHVLALSETSTAEHLHAAGFEVEQTFPRFIPYSFRGSLPASPLLTRLYLRLPAVWRLLGKQFLLVARKP